MYADDLTTDENPTHSLTSGGQAQGRSEACFIFLHSLKQSCPIAPLQVMGFGNT